MIDPMVFLPQEKSLKCGSIKNSNILKYQRDQKLWKPSAHPFLLYWYLTPIPEKKKLYEFEVIKSCLLNITQV